MNLETGSVRPTLHLLDQHQDRHSERFRGPPYFQLGAGLIDDSLWRALRRGPHPKGGLKAGFHFEARNSLFCKNLKGVPRGFGPRMEGVLATKNPLIPERKDEGNFSFVGGRIPRQSDSGD